MANKIDKINVSGADYEINLPTTATPSISSLTVTGNLTCSGTANLSVISFTSRSEAGLIKAQSLTLSTNEPQHFISGLGFVFSAPYANRTIEFSFPTTAGGKISEITFTNEDTENYIDAYRDRFDFKNAPITVSSIGTSLSTLCQLPNKSGTVALTDDCFSSVSVYSTFRNDASTEKFPLSISKNGRLQFYILKGARPGSSTLSVDVNLALYNGGSLVETI